MAVAPAYIALNHTSTQRMRALAARLTDAEMLSPVGEHWTVGVVFAHLAFWDRRVIDVFNKAKRNEEIIMDIDIVVNDLSLPLWSAIPPREAARIALATAEELDTALENMPSSVLETVYNLNKRWVMRGLHRGEHLDEVDHALIS